MYVFISHACPMPVEARKVGQIPRTEVTAVSHFVGSRIWTLVLCKNSQCQDCRVVLPAPVVWKFAHVKFVFNIKDPMSVSNQIKQASIPTTDLPSWHFQSSDTVTPPCPCHSQSPFSGTMWPHNVLSEIVTLCWACPIAILGHVRSVHVP